MKVPILENTFRDAKSSYQLPPEKNKKAPVHTFLWIIQTIGLAAQLKGFAVPSQDWQHIKTLSYFAAFCSVACFPFSAQLKATRDFFFHPQRELTLYY